MSKSRTSAEATTIILEALENGSVTYSRPHAVDRMQQRNLQNADIENVLRGCVVSDAYKEHGKWRHKAITAKIEVVVQILSEENPRIMIITAWRK
jgi:hypothetical protein